MSLDHGYYPLSHKNEGPIHTVTSCLFCAVMFFTLGDRTACRNQFLHCFSSIEQEKIQAMLLEAINEDASFLNESRGGNVESNINSLMKSPLWLDDVRGNSLYSTNFPIWARAPWDAFKESEAATRSDFSPWIFWYESLLSPHSNEFFGKSVSYQLSLQNDHWWSRDARKVNSDIVLLLKELAKQDQEDDKPKESLQKDIQEALENVPTQSPAAFRYYWSDQHIKAAPPDSAPSDAPTAQDLLDETRQKASALKEKLRNSNSNQRVVKSIDGLIAVLPEKVDAIRPGLLRSRTRAIEADAEAFSAPSAELELFEDAVAALFDVSKTARDLQACFPALRDIEAELVALAIPPSQTEAVRIQLDAITEQAVRSADVIDESSADSLRVMASIASEEAPPRVREKRVAEYALVVRNLLSRLVRMAVASSFSKEVTGTMREIWEKARPKIVQDVADGLSAMSKPAVVAAVSLLVNSLFGPVAGLSVALVGFGKIDRLLKLIEKRLERELGETPGDTDGDDPGAV